MTDINDLKAENNRLRSMLARAGISILPATTCRMTRSLTGCWRWWNARIRY